MYSAGHNELACDSTIIFIWVVGWTAVIVLVKPLMLIPKQKEFQATATRPRSSVSDWVILAVVAAYPFVMDWAIKSPKIKLYISLVFFGVPLLLLWLFGRKAKNPNR
jgi:hypothetical protein